MEEFSCQTTENSLKIPKKEKKLNVCSKDLNKLANHLESIIVD